MIKNLAFPPITRKNKILEVSPLKHSYGIKVTITELSGRFSLTGNQYIEKIISFHEDNPLRLGEFIDALTHPDVLHPIHKDVRISPFGDNSGYWIHITWEGWHENEIKLLPANKAFPELKEMVMILNAVQSRASTLIKAGEKMLLKNTEISQEEIENFFRKCSQFLVDAFSEILPVNPWTLRGFLPLPFRRLTIGRFKDNQTLSIRLSPAEARRLARFVSLVSGLKETSGH
jgi:hypothetical protein